MMTPPELNILKKHLINQIGDPLQFIILEGSYNSDSWVQGWSDIDFLIGVKDLTYELQISLFNISNRITNKFGVSTSLDAVSLNEITYPKDIFFWNQSKTIQALYECYLFPEKLIYKIDENLNLHKLTNNEISLLSLKNVAYFYQEIHKSIQRDFDRDSLDNLSLLTKKIIKYSINLTKFAIQYRNIETIRGRKDIIKFAETIFPTFSFDHLKKINSIIKKWAQISRESSALQKTLNETINYVDSFTIHFYQHSPVKYFDLTENFK